MNNSLQKQETATLCTGKTFLTLGGDTARMINKIILIVTVIAAISYIVKTLR